MFLYLFIIIIIFLKNETILWILISSIFLFSFYFMLNNIVWTSSHVSSTFGSTYGFEWLCNIPIYVENIINLTSPLTVEYWKVIGFHYYKQCSSECFCIVFFSYLKEVFIIYENVIYYKAACKIVGNVNYTFTTEIG